MTLQQKFEQAPEVYDANFEKVKGYQKIAEQFTIEFVEWKDSACSLYKDSTYYFKTTSKHFDITKCVDKEKPTKYYTVRQLLEIYKKEQVL